jgi:ADP-ribose pyrophosphatase
VQLPDGSVHDDYHHIVLPEFAVTVTVLTDGRFVMVREYKPGPNAALLGCPAGMLHDGEAPLAAARRELLEETGYVSDDWHPLGSFVVDGGTGCGRAHLFLARNVVRQTTPRPDATEEIDVVVMTEAELRAALAAGEVKTLPAACAIGLALVALRG